MSDNISLNKLTDEVRARVYRFCDEHNIIPQNNMVPWIIVSQVQKQTPGFDWTASDRHERQVQQPQPAAKQEAKPAPTPPATKAEPAQEYRRLKCSNVWCGYNIKPDVRTTTDRYWSMSGKPIGFTSLECWGCGYGTATVISCDREGREIQAEPGTRFFETHFRENVAFVVADKQRVNSGCVYYDGSIRRWGSDPLADGWDKYKELSRFKALSRLSPEARVAFEAEEKRLIGDGK